MSSLVSSSPFFGKRKSSYEYYHWKIMSEKQTNPKPGDVYEKIGHTLPGVHDATYLVKKRGYTHYKWYWNKTRKFFRQPHGNIVIKYERINITGGNVPIYLDEKPITAHMYKWADWGREFKFVGKIWNGLEPGTIVKDKNIELVEDMARRLAYEDPKNKDVDWVIKRKEREKAEEEREWLNSDEGRLWQLQRHERKEYFDKYNQHYFYRERTYPNTAKGRLLEEEDKRWREEADNIEAERVKRSLKEHRERLDREAEEARQREAEEAARQRRELHQRQQQREQEQREHEEWVRQRDERIRERDRVVRGGGNPNDDLDIEPYEPPHWQVGHLMTISKLKF